MNPRYRKLLGAVIMLVLVIVWVLTAMTFAQLLPSTNGWAAWLFYVVAGMGWVFPAMPLVRWMTRGDKPPVKIL